MDPSNPGRSLVGAAVALVFALASAPVAAAVQCKLAVIDEWPVRVVNNRLIVDGAIDGQKIAILLGTGAQQSIVLHSAAERLGLPRQWAKGSPLYGIRGESRLEVTSVRELRVGQLSRRGMRFAVPIDENLGDGIDVVLGEDFFHSVDVEFDLARETVRLFEPADCPGVPLAYWTTDRASEVAIEPVFSARPQILLTVRVNGQPVRALLDSGATVSILSKRDAAAAGVTPRTAGAVAVGKIAGFGENAVDAWIGPFESIAIGDQDVRNTRLRFADLYRKTTYMHTGSNLPKNVDQEQPMLLGVDFLRAHRVLVAHSQRRIYFTYSGGPVFDTETKDLVPAASAWLSLR